MEDPTPGPMQRCIRMPELVNIICGEIDADKSGRLAMLSNLARTSHLFHESALDYLWSSLDGIERLIKCMPIDVWKEELTEDPNRLTLVRLCYPYPSCITDVQKIFTRPIIQSDLSRLQHYAHRIKKFQSIGQIAKSYTDSSVANIYQALLLTETSALLPRLYTLSWMHVDDNIFPYIRLFLGPNLTELTVIFNPNSVIQLSLLSTLRQRNPHIRRLHIHHIWGMTDILRSTIEDTVCGLNGLHTLTVPDLTPTTLAHLANLPNLRTLKVSSASPHNGYATMPGSVGFPTLKRFDILFCDGFQMATAAIEAMSSCRLKTFIVRFVLSSTPDAWKRMLLAAEKNYDHTSLRILNISSYFDPFNTPERVPIRMDTLRPLTSFSGISNLKLNPAGGVDLDDTDIKDLARSWPRLKHLQLGWNFPGHPHPRMTLSSLVSIAEYCPSLCTLYMLVDACTVPAITTSRPAGRVRHHSLVCLGIGGSPIDSEAGVAVFLSDVFPCVDSVDAMVGGLLEMNETIQRWSKVWEQVDNLLPMLAAVRKQERPDSDSDLSDEES